MAQQTAVNYLFYEIAKIMNELPPLDDTIISKMKEARKRAKEMEKEQIIKAYNQDLYGGLSGDKKFDDGEQYYNKTYGIK